MNKLIARASAAVLFGFTAIAGMTPAVAGQTAQEQDHATFCNANPNYKGCSDWQAPQPWGRGPYQSSNRWQHYDRGYSNNPAAVLFGLAIGLGAAGALSDGYYGRDHVEACERTYRSYDVRSDTFLGYDRYRHACRL